MNRAVRALWHVSDEQAESHPPYSQLVNEARITGTYGVSASELDKYISSRIDGVRAGDATPFDLRHSDGRTIRSQCAVLPNGGRMLTYSDITDLVRQADELQRLTGLYNRRHFQVLADGEWSRFQRYNRPLSVVIFDIDILRRSTTVSVTMLETAQYNILQKSAGRTVERQIFLRDLEAMNSSVYCRKPTSDKRISWPSVCGGHCCKSLLLSMAKI